MSELDSLFSIIKKAKEKYKDKSPEPVIQQEISPLNSLFEKIKEKQEEKNKDVDTSISSTYESSVGGIRLHKPENGSLQPIDREISNEELYSHGAVEDRMSPLQVLGQATKEVFTAPVYGNYNVSSSFYNTLANIPGGLSSLSKFVADKYGKKLELSESGMIKALDYAEEYLRNLSVKVNPSPDNPYFTPLLDYRPEAPRTFTGKVMSAIGQAPVTVGEYLPAMKVAGAVGKGLKGFTAVKKTPSVVKGVVSPAAVGFAATDALREIDKGGEAATIAGLKGFLLGRTMNAFEPFNFRTRVTAMGTLGFGATDGNFEDRLVGGITFATLSAIGKIEGKSLKDAQSDLGSYLSGQNINHKRMVEAKVKENTIMLKTITNLADNLETITKEISSVKQAKVDNKKSINDKQLKTLEKKKERIEKDIFTLRDNYHHSLVDTIYSKEFLDTRSVDAVIESMMKPKEIVTNPNTKRKEYVYEKTEKDIASKYKKGTIMSGIDRLLKEFLFQNAPPTFFAKNTNSLFKKAVDETKIITREKELAIDNLFRNPEFNKETSYFQNIISGFNPKNIFKKGKEVSVLPASMYAKTGISPNSPEAILTVNSKSIPKIFELGAALEKFATKNKNKRSLFNKKTNDLTVKALKEEFKLNESEMAVYFSIRKLFREPVRIFNEFGKKYAGPEFKPVKELPSYFAHMFTGEHRIFVNRKSDNKLMAVLGATNIIAAKKLQKSINKNIKDVNAEVKQRKVTGDLAVSLFAEMHNLLRTDKALLEKIRPFIDDAFIKGGMSSHRMPRKQNFVEGYAGGSLELYRKIGIPEQKARNRNAEEGIRSVLFYAQGALGAAYQLKLKHQIKKILDNPILNKQYPTTLTAISRYYDGLFSGDFTGIAAKGRLSLSNARYKHPFDEIVARGADQVGLTKGDVDAVLKNVNGFTYLTKLLMFNFRFLGSQIIQPYQMITTQLYRLQAIGQGANPVAAMLKSQLDLIKPSKEIKELIQYNIKQKSISAAFHEDFVSALKGGFTTKWQRLGDAASGRNLASRLEQFSRLNSALMIYRTIRENGVSHKEAMRKTPHLVDTYMVEYNMLQKPLLYSSSGFLGQTAGKPFGVFKTFMHNYLAQAVEHVRTTRKTGDIMPTTVFLTNMLITAGLFGFIGIGTLDLMLTSLDKSAGAAGRLINPDFKIPTVSDILYEKNLHPAILFGAVSDFLKMDMSATLSAPAQLGLDSIFTPPPGYTISKEVLRSSYKYFTKVIQAMTSKGINRENILADEYAFLYSFAPNVMQPVLELYYNAAMRGEDFVDFSELANWDFSSLLPDEYIEQTKNESVGPVLVISKGKVTARLQREMDDWRARFFSAKSIKESHMIKTQWYLLKMQNKNALKDSDFARMGALAFLKTGTVPQIVFDHYISRGISPEQAWEKRIMPIIRSLNTSVVERSLRGGYTKDKQQIFDYYENEFIGDLPN